MGHRKQVLVILVGLLLIFSGCSSGGDTAPTDVENPTPSPTDVDNTPTETATITPTPTPTPAQTATESTIPRGPDQGTSWTVTITRVIDGDTVEAEFPNGEIDTLRLLGVDTPETTLSRVSPEEFEGIPDTVAGRDHLFNWGKRATSYATTQLEGKTLEISVDPDADRRGGFNRLLAYISVDGENFNKQLLTNGYARMYDSSFSLREEFAEAEETARTTSVGLWAFEQPSTHTATSITTPTQTPSGSDVGLTVSNIHADAAGNDNENLNDEYVVFTNEGSDVLRLGGWEVEDAADHIYHIPSGFKLNPRESVTLYTGSGRNTNSELYWKSGRAIWNNGGDTIIVRDDSGSVVLEYSY